MTYPAWPDLSPDALERELLETWKDERLFHRTLEQHRDGTPFVFFEGPPTANGRPGIHHVFSRTLKDLVCRFRAMQGRSVTRIAGWDTHGLPVEIEVEKQLQLKGKRDIETFGIERFNALCRESVFTYVDDWEAMSDRIGYWLDYENAYITCSNPYIESVWALLKRLWEKRLLTRGHRVLPYCPRCGTVLSSHELALGYEDIRDKSIYVAFPLEDGTGRELVVWTTTPWTLPSNVAVAVRPDLEYGTYEVSGRKLVLATGRAGVLGAEPPAARDTFPGRALVGVRYRRPLDVVPIVSDNGTHSVVIAGDFVSADEGTGLVHMAPAFGADDYAAGQRQGLVFLRPVAPDGTFQGTSWPALEGRLVTAEETNELITRRLKDEGLLLRTESYEHSYPHCWRCQSKLIYYARDSWFVRTSAIKDRLVELNAGIDWHPAEVGTKRFGDWLANNVDWALSRDRYWGTPLPVWVADDDPTHVEVIGSYAELAEKVGRPLPAGFDPHKPFIDEYTWPSPAGGTMRRQPEVIDAWFDSGSMPYAQWHWPFEHQDQFERHFPADYICEAIDQTRGWFYSLLAISATLFDRAAYRHVVVNEMVLDAEGQKMSKSRGNVVDPMEVLAEFGADQVRLYLLATSEVGKPKRFDRRSVPEVAGGFLTTLRNTYQFFALYAGEKGEKGEQVERGGPAVLDRWLLAALQDTVNQVVSAWERYDITAGVKAIMRFVIDDLSNWYVRLSRSRFWAPGTEPDAAAVRSLHRALTTVARLLAPAAPFVSDWLHRALVGESVHLAEFPVPAPAGEEALRDTMNGIRTLASLARAAREDAGIRVRQPLGALRVAVPASVQGALSDGLLDLLAREVNVKRVEIVGGEAELVTLRGRPNFRSLGKRYGKGTPAAASQVGRLRADQLRVLEAGQPVTLQSEDGIWEYLPEDVAVERKVSSDWLVRSEGPFVAALDPTLTPALRAEGIARELVSRIQRLRKDAGYEYTARIRIAVDGPGPVREAAVVHREFIAGETLARELVTGRPGFVPDRLERVKIDNHAATIAVGRLDDGDAANP